MRIGRVGRVSSTVPNERPGTSMPPLKITGSDGTDQASAVIPTIVLHLRDHGHEGGHTLGSGDLEMSDRGNARVDGIGLRDTQVPASHKLEEGSKRDATPVVGLNRPNLPRRVETVESPALVQTGNTTDRLLRLDWLRLIDLDAQALQLLTNQTLPLFQKELVELNVVMQETSCVCSPAQLPISNGMYTTKNPRRQADYN